MQQPAEGKPAYENMSLEELLQVPVIVTASREEEAATEAPATTVVITREEIRLRGYSFLKDVLRDLPGMETKEYTNALTGGTQTPVRGVIGNNKILFLVNGMRVNPPGGEALLLQSDFSVRDADQIEIVYGPGSTLYGQDAISAVINVITRRTEADNVRLSAADLRARLLQPTPMSARMLSVGIELGHPWQKEVWSSLNARIGQARVYGSVHYLDKQLTDLSSAYPEFWAQHEMVTGGRGLPLDPKRYDTGLNVMFRFEYGQSSIQIWHRQSARNASEGFSLPPRGGFVNEARWEDMSTVAEVRNVLPIGRYFSLETLLTFNRFEVRPGTRIVSTTTMLPGQPPMWILNDFKYGRGVSGALSERLTFSLGQRLKVVAGFFAAHYDVVPLSSIPSGVDFSQSIASQGGSFTYYERQGDPTSAVTQARVNPVAYQNFGGYLEGNWRIAKPLRLIVGFRLDKNTSVADLAFSPRAALIFNYRSFTAKYIFARAFVAPAPTDKYLVIQTPVRLQRANPALAPETATSNELNLSFNHPRVSIGASFYYNLQDNLVFQSGFPANAVGQVWLDPEGMRAIALSQVANGGESKALGVDLFSKFNFWKFSGWASYSYTNFSLQATGMDEPLPTRGLSAHNVRLGLTYSILKNLHATLGTIVRSLPENLMIPDPLAGLVGTPWELNAHLLYSPIPSIDLYVDFKNLTNNKYYLAGGSGTGSAAYPIQAFQGSAGLRFSL